MTTPPTQRKHVRRDGTSQASRVQAALAPDYVKVDERSVKDWLEFARALAGRLRFHDPDAPGEQLDWRGFLGPDLELDQVLEFLEHPEPLSKAGAERFSGPHFVLLLTFYKLMQVAQGHLNSLTRRHLEHYYRDILRMTREAPVSDLVNVILELERDAPALALKAGARLDGGKDEAGRPRVYETTRDVLLTQAQVAELRTVFTDMRVTGIREARERRDPETNAKSRFVRMFEFALGHPLPGDPLRRFAGEDVTLELLRREAARVAFCSASLHMELYDLRTLVQLKQRRGAAADPEWAEINALLQKAGRARVGDDAWSLSPSAPRDFTANLTKALGAAPDELYFAGVTEVKSVDQLHARRQRMIRLGSNLPDNEVDAFIHERLHFKSLADFDRMMLLKTRVDTDWRDLNRILERAGQRKRDDRSYRMSVTEPSDFAANLAAAIAYGGFAWPEGSAGVDAYYAAIEAIEAYFFMPAEKFAYVMAGAPGETPEERATLPPRTWSRIYAHLEEAHRAKVYSDRRAALSEARASDGWVAMLYHALGEPVADGSDAPARRLTAHIKRSVDADFLLDVDARVKAGQGGGVSATEWSRVIYIVELAQRVRERLPPPVARKIEWHNLYANEDATTALVSLGLDSDKTPRWRTFGRRPAVVKGAPPESNSLGWALSSPLLALGEGERTVTLVLGFRAAGWRDAKIAALLAADPFQIEISGEKAWITPASVEVTHGDYAALSGASPAPEVPLRALKIVLSLGVDADPVGVLDAKTAGVTADAPVIRLLLRERWQDNLGTYTVSYTELRDLVLVRAHVRTRVTELGAIVAANDDTSLETKKPYEPFGGDPAIGSRFYFGHPELLGRQVDEISCSVQWMGAPKRLDAHYANYPEAPSNADYTVEFRMIQRRRAIKVEKAATLFHAGDARERHAITMTGLAGVTANAPRDGAGAAPPSDVLDWSRYLEWELTPKDFQHGAYANTATLKSLQLTEALSKGQAITAASYQVNTPYTPKIRRMTLGYTASTEVALADTFTASSSAPVGAPVGARLFHIRPFGSHEIRPEDGEAEARFLPLFAHEGELYIGLAGVKAPQQVTLLFQMAEGSADPDLEPAPVRWSYLSGDRWLSLHNGDILRDSTRGLINSGIMELSLAATLPSAQLPGELFWIRAGIPREPRSVCDTVAIHAQAVPAVFVDQDNAASHYERPLPPRSVTGLVDAHPEIRAVSQPYTSFGGKPQEAAAAFYARVSERLRHKQRALTVWDYERLILERFPQIYKVKCLPANIAENPDAPGQVDIVVIPDIRGQLPFDPFEPKAPANLLADIEAFIQTRSPPHATVRVRNPRYVSVKVRFGVRFKPGHDEGYYRALLNDELNRFLSPWAYEDGADIVIGDKIYANSVINFVDKRDYVDYIASIRLFRSVDGEDYQLVLAPQAQDARGYYVTTERPDAVLVAAREHEIDVISEVDYEEQRYTGINYMKVELDFVVG